MKYDSLIFEKSFRFSIRITNAYKFLTKEHKEFILSKQVYLEAEQVSVHYLEKFVKLKAKKILFASYL